MALHRRGNAPHTTAPDRYSITRKSDPITWWSSQNRYALGARSKPRHGRESVAELPAHVVGAGAMARRGSPHHELSTTERNEVRQVGGPVRELEDAELPLQVGDVGTEVVGHAFQSSSSPGLTSATSGGAALGIASIAIDSPGEDRAGADAGRPYMWVYGVRGESGT